MAWYGRDYGERGWGGTHRPGESGWGRGQRQREGGWGGSQWQGESGWERGRRGPESGWGGRYQPRESSWGGGYQPRESNRDYDDEGLGGWYRGRGREGRGGYSEEYDRDMGDQLREGWRDLKRGVRRAFGGGEYDQSYRGGSMGRARYDEGHTERGWRGRDWESPGWGAENRGYRGRDWNRDRFW